MKYFLFRVYLKKVSYVTEIVFTPVSLYAYL